MPIGQVLLVAAALGKSLGTLLGPSAATKMVYQDSSRTTGAAVCASGCEKIGYTVLYFLFYSKLFTDSDSDKAANGGIQVLIVQM